MQTTTRRTIVTQAAGALAITALPVATAAATASDPALALIDAHRKAEQRFFAFRWDEDDQVLNERGEQQLTELGDEADDLAWDLAHCQPASIAGCAAVLKYVGEPGPDPNAERWPNDSDNWDDWPRTLCASLAAALERIARA